MIDQSRASHLAKQGFELWAAGRPQEAIPLYEEALLLADPAHFNLGSYHGELAAVLSATGRMQQALVQYQLALAAERRHADDSSPCVITARYLLAEHHLHMGKPQKALETVEPIRQRNGTPRAGKSH